MTDRETKTAKQSSLAVFLFSAMYPESALGRCANRAGTCTSTAVNAGSCVDNVLAVTLRNSIYRTSLSAGAASDALVRNNVCHNSIPP